MRATHVASREALRQRPELTHRFNRLQGRHGWLRLTPAYSVRIVEELLTGARQGERVLDPFAGTATTALCAAARGHDAVAVEINPFLVWLGRAKVARYTPTALTAARTSAYRAAELAACQSLTPAPLPPIHRPDRWWHPTTQASLSHLRAAIEAVATPESAERTLLLVAFCRTLIACSNAAFDHQSLSFAGSIPSSGLHPSGVAARFLAEIQDILPSAAANPPGHANVLQGDARRLDTMITTPIDRVITSPPYANRMSYIRELRPYMYWLGFLSSGREAGELDWAAIGGTWGLATSRLSAWQRQQTHFLCPWLDTIAARIAQKGERSGPLLAAYVVRYADDMWQHFQSLARVLAPGASVHYIIGNSSFYGIVVPTERLYAEMLAAAGFHDITYRPIRKRNSKKELIEFEVAARWPG